MAGAHTRQVFEVAAVGRGSRGKPFQLGPVFAALDKAKAELGLESYTLSQTTLEQARAHVTGRRVG